MTPARPIIAASPIRLIAVVATLLAFVVLDVHQPRTAQAVDVNCPSASASLSGAGSPGDPYLVQSAADLQLLKTSIPSLSASYLQTGNIDMQQASSDCVWDRGINGVFSGTYDGGGFAISGLQVTSSQFTLGLFETVSGTLKNLEFTGNVTNSFSLNNNNTGGLVGLLDGGTIQNSTTNGNIRSTRTDGTILYVGGLVGQLDGGTIQNSSATGNVSSANTEFNSSGTGGLVGLATRVSTITDSHATGTVTSLMVAGGLVGRTTSTVSIIRSYATGVVAATTALGSAGGLVGYLQDASVEKSYATGNVSGVADAQHLGALFATMTRSSVTDSYATGGVSGWTQSNTTYGQVGGLVGDATGGTNTLTRTYSATISGMSSSGDDTDQVGGVAGVVATTTWNSVAWNRQTAAPLVLNPIGSTPTVVGVSSYTTSELNDITTFTDPVKLNWNTGGAQTIAAGYDASYTWGICSTVNFGYPFLTALYSSNPCAFAPQSPTLSSVTGGDASLTLTWTLGSDGGSPVTNVEYSTDDSLTWRSVVDSTLPSDTIVVDSSGNSLVNGTTYQVRVRAVNSLGNGVVSNMLPGTPTAPTPPTPTPTPTPTPSDPPSAPMNVIGIAGDAQAVISWDRSASAGSFPVTAYQVVVSPGGHTCLVSAPTTSCPITGLTNGATYTAMVRALNGAGWGSWSDSSASFTPQGAVTRSIVITGTRAEVNGRSGVRAFGETTGLVGATVQARVHLSGEIYYYDGSRRMVSEDGSFTWQRQTNKKVYVYFRVVDDPAVRSNRLIIAIR